MFAAWGSAAKLKMGPGGPAANPAVPAAFLFKFPEVSDTPGLYSGGFLPGRAKLAHVAYD